MKKLWPSLCCLLLPAALTAQTETTPTPQWRPVYHFTPEKNWTNDPNGLVYVNGVYHLYNQQNPFENKWGHMSWGHATSADLIHWKHLPVAIPEIMGSDTTWRFSGSAVLDKDNTSGWCKNGNCLVAIYTGHQQNPAKESQFVAYSNDGGITFTNYEKNPVIDLEKHDFRDPNVWWYAPGKYWLMTVVLPTEHKALFYRSPDLKSWTLLSEFGPQGYTGSNWECPFLIRLPVEGTKNEKKWVLVISAAGGRGVFEQYFVGDFDGRAFKNDNPKDTVLTLDYGDTYYAAIPWNNLPEGRHTYIGWMIPNPQPTFPWRGQMSIPRDLSLRQTPNGLRLIQRPAAVISNQLDELSHGRTLALKNLRIGKKEAALDKNGKIKGNAWWMKATLTVAPGADAGFKIAQEKDAAGRTIHETIVGYDAASRQVYIDRSRTGGDINKDRARQAVTLQAPARELRLEILLDRSSLEVFVNDGEAALTTYIYPVEGADQLSAFSQNGKTVIRQLKLWNLSR
ncbi:glycoside hydrolase family 32 protein [Compostibacter hankyongensis]|uniref:Glycoside hydrolase family 32 protein n=1 Tax=Compostibacter hankyongensis TaxID=1007089 RepID=A0ABP8FBI5_9BACT